METWSAYVVGRYVPSEGSLLIRHRNDRIPSSERKAIIVLPGHDALPTIWTPGSAIGDHAQVLADFGYWVFSPDAGGGQTWNNATAMTAITAAYNWLIAQGLAGTKIGLMGWSMGGGECLQWMKENPTLVSGTCVWAPMTNLDYYQSGAYTAEINTAYAGNYAANSIGRKIAGEYSSWEDLGPIRINHGSVDPTCPLSHSEAFVDGVGQPQVELITIPGANHYPFASIPIADTLAFFNAANW